MRAFLGGIVTETNTFSPIPTGSHDWEIVRDLASAEEGSAIQAFGEEAAKRGDTLIVGLNAHAMPAGVTTWASYRKLRDELLGQVKAALPLQAVFLSLHGAMVADGPDGEWIDDVEGDLIVKTREIVGPDVKIGVHIDLHCHLTQTMLDSSDVVVIYKEYPHTDMADRARDLYRLIAATIDGTVKPVMALADARMMGIVPTDPQPMRGYVDAMIAAEGKDGILSLSLGHGFPWGDVPDSGARALAVVDAAVHGDTTTQVAANTAREWARRFHELRASVIVRPLPLDDALDRALEVIKGGRAPVVIADQADNAGAGAASDSTFVLRRLLERRVPRAAVAMVWDPVAHHVAKAAGEGARLSLRLGGKMGPTSGDPLDLDVTVAGLIDGLVQRWPQTEGAVDSPGGNVAHLKVHGFAGSADGEPGPSVDVIVTTRRGQVLGLEPFTAFGITPETHDILIVKSIQHFHAAFAPIAAEVIYMAAPGAVAPIMQLIPLKRADLNKYPWVEEALL